MILPTILLVVLVIATVFQITHFYPFLPDLVVSHCGPGGQPDGWLGKTTFFWAMAISELIVTGCFVAIALVLPNLSKRWINIPNKNFWLEPERQHNTIRYIQVHILWFAVIIEAAMVLLWQSTINANVKPELHWPANFWWTLTITIIIFALWMTRFNHHFKSIPST
jgi:uncharacterized membrane protein